MNISPSRSSVYIDSVPCSPEISKYVRRSNNGRFIIVHISPTIQPTVSNFNHSWLPWSFRFLFFSLSVRRVYLIPLIATAAEKGRGRILKIYICRFYLSFLVTFIRRCLATLSRKLLCMVYFVNVE